MNPGGESVTPKGRGRGFSRHEQGHKELRRPQAEKRTGTDIDMKMEGLCRIFCKEFNILTNIE